MIDAIIDTWDYLRGRSKRKQAMEKYLDDECKRLNITDKAEIEEFKRAEKAKNNKFAYKVLFYTFLPCFLIMLYVWFLIGLE